MRKTKEKKREVKKKEQLSKKGTKCHKSKWWKQCICTVLEIRMHEYVENMVNGQLAFVLWLHGLSKVRWKV